MSVVELSKQSVRVRIIKQPQKPPKDKFIESHELSLLSLLVEKHPERAKEFLARLKRSMEAA